MTNTIPELSPVKSSNIAAVAHDGGHLFVKFSSGAVWKYHDVPADTHSEMLNSGSIGSYFARAIKPRFKAVKISD